MTVAHHELVLEDIDKPQVNIIRCLKENESSIQDIPIALHCLSPVSFSRTCARRTLHKWHCLCLLQQAEDHHMDVDHLSVGKPHALPLDA
jgi:hypothetical protein